jgi:hypothetical protein
MASRENLFTPPAIWIITAWKGMSMYQAPISADRPRE